MVAKAYNSIPALLDPLQQSLAVSGQDLGFQGKCLRSLGQRGGPALSVRLCVIVSLIKQNKSSICGIGEVVIYKSWEGLLDR